jgi:hypothetical protein
MKKAAATISAISVDRNDCGWAGAASVLIDCEMLVEPSALMALGSRSVQTSFLGVNGGQKRCSDEVQAASL